MTLDLSKPFTKTGKFFMPKQSVSWCGTFFYDPNNGLTLHLRDFPLSCELYSMIPIMNGMIDDAPHSCTLSRIILQKRVSSGNSDGIVCTSIFTVNYIFLGKHISDTKELVFDQVDFIYSNFREWLNKPTVFTQSINNDIVATIKKLPKIKGALDELFGFEVDIVNTGYYPEESFGICLEQSVVFSIVSKNNETMDLNKYLEMNKIVKYFFMFVQGRYVTEKTISCRKRSEEINVDLLQFYNQHRPAKKLSKTEQFAYAYDAPTFEKTLQNWIKKYKQMPDFFDRFCENMIKEDLSHIDKFENLIQSLLFYHNHNFEDNESSKKEYNEFFKKLVSKLDNKEKCFVERFQGMGNKLSLRKRLKQMSERVHTEADKNFRDQYINKIIALRNDIEHSIGNTAPEIPHRAFSMTRNLTAFVSRLILYEIKYEQRKK